MACSSIGFASSVAEIGNSVGFIGDYFIAHRSPRGGLQHEHAVLGQLPMTAAAVTFTR